MKKHLVTLLVAFCMSVAFIAVTAWSGSSECMAGDSCYTCKSSSTGKCKGMMYCKGSEKACKAAGCRLGSSSPTSCPTSANYKAKTCTP